MLRAAASHRGAALVEIYQNCNIYNDGAFVTLQNVTTREDATLRLEHGTPLRYGRDGKSGIIRGPDGGLRVAQTAEIGEEQLLIHDTHADNPELAFALSRLPSSNGAAPTGPTPIGVFRDVDRPSYDELMNAQLDTATSTQGPGNLTDLLTGPDTWIVT